MTSYLNPSTRHGGVEQIVVAEQPVTVPVDEAPFDDTQHVRVNGEWVPVDFPEIIPDTLAPSAPTSLSSTGIIAIGGGTVSYALAWVAPTTNVDATPLVDLSYYVVRWRYGSSGPWATFVSNEVSALIPGVLMGLDLQWEVLARDYSGNDSTWAAATITGVLDTVGPDRPSIPVLSSRLGTITATWNGLDQAGLAPPPDFHRLEFYSSATTGGPWVYVDQVSGAGTVFITNVAVGDTRFVTTIAVDKSGNASVRSAEASILVVGITAPDIEANAIITNKLAAGSVDTVAIAAGAVTAGKIGVGAVTALTIAADAIDGKTITGATIRTAAPPNARWEIDSVTPIDYPEGQSEIRAYTGSIDETAEANIVVASLPGAALQLRIKAPTGVGGAAGMTLQSPVAAGPSALFIEAAETYVAKLYATGLISSDVGFYDHNVKQPRFHRQNSGGVITSSTGIASFAHGAPFTPTSVFITMKAAANSFAVPWGSTLLNATTCSFRWMNATGGAFVSASTGAWSALYVE